MHNWEYKRVILAPEKLYPPSDIEKEFNALGQEGWEFCCDLGVGTSLYILLFKRPLYDEKSWDRAMDGMLDLFDDEEDEDEA